ncbi:spore germination protein KB [Paenibacillus mucilaginosus 3016]|uniref:Spore germination protein KB n=2 Tax=Paenibacillus mucilaginosus TaxID=61624 RepID=H6NJG1_9BACL|nr:endospore germination permease [Paenibacillus mucilaginosus]AFC29240.1 spore germination protein KB [Paenibacillus mucilaginosus 3016]AFH61419.1 spore germination protein KB [Paenibacillus mucilaginosus K02]WFA17967.1 spore gernimation protein KB [Paenibacillus mucilaginosus]
MQKAKINAGELAALMLLFEMGTSVVVGVGMQAKQDAPLAILIGMASGLLLFLIYDSLYRRHGNLSLVGWLQAGFGRPLGGLAAMLYMLYFFYIAARVMRDFGALLLSSILPLTPMAAVHLVMVLPVMYACLLGIETIGRVGEIFLSIVVFLGVLSLLLLIASNVLQWENLLPPLEHGWKPVLKTAFPLTTTFPFGELVVFTMLLPCLNHPRLARKTGLTVILISGFALSSIITLNISVLSLYGAENTTFPLLRTLGKIRLGEFIERLEVIAIVTLIIGGFFKITIFLYASIMGFTELFHIRKRRRELTLCLGALLFLYSLLMTDSFIKHIEVGLKIVPLYLHLPFQVVLPLLLLALTWVRGRVQAQGR